jgi:hypothetical protein
VNLFHEMPEEVLMAEGSVWLVSSRANDPSYEDRTLGGVFTHFFMEALEKAPADGVGITLDSIWNYARRKTVDYTSSRQRRQTPEQVVARLRTRGPMYFSFPMARTARLVLDEGLAGNVVLEYGDGQLVDTMYKQVGRRQELRVFPGPARIKLVEANRDQAQVTQFSLSVAAEAEMTYRTAIGSCMAWADPATERFTAYAPRT